MIDRVVVLALAGSAALVMLLFWEWQTTELISDSHSISATAPNNTPTPPQVQHPRVEELVAIALERPLFAAGRRAPHRTAAERATEPQVSNLRLTGIVIEPGRRIAIFAVPGAKPLLRSEGESVNEWRLETIEPQEVKLSGPAGNAILQPVPDPDIVRLSQIRPAQAARPIPAPAPPAAPASPITARSASPPAPRVAAPPRGEAVSGNPTPSLSTPAVRFANPPRPPQ